MNKFKATAYKIVIQEKEIEAENYFVAYAIDIPDVKVYESNPLAAYESVCQVIEDLYETSKERGRNFPLPSNTIEEV
jgi:hypothetical protein